MFVVTEPVVEFITVLVYTCSRNCWSQHDKFVEEFAMVEYDHDSTVIEEALSHLAGGLSSTALQQTLSHSA